MKDAKVKEWWEEAWASPMRHGWKVGDGIALDRLAFLWHAFLQGDGKNPIEGAILAIEDRLGLSPKARRLMGWEIERGGGDPKAAAGPQPVDDMRQRLKAVP